MSKQSDAKKAQNYIQKLDPKVCANCCNLQLDKIPANYNPRVIVEKNLRCGIGMFAVKKMGTCDFFSKRVDEEL